MQCYIRCYLEGVGILKDDELNREKATEMAWASADDTLDECEKEVAGKFGISIIAACTCFNHAVLNSERTNPCEKAYFLTRCVMMRNIVDQRTASN